MAVFCCGKMPTLHTVELQKNDNTKIKLLSIYVLTTFWWRQIPIEKALHPVQCYPVSCGQQYQQQNWHISLKDAHKRVHATPLVWSECVKDVLESNLTQNSAINIII